MRCIFCGAPMNKVNSSFNASWGKYEIEIKGLEPFKCSSCGEEIFSPEESELIQGIARGYAESQIIEKPTILTLDEVSDLLKISHQTVYNMIKDGRLQAYKVGREWRFNRSEIEQLLQPRSAIAIAGRGNVSTKDINIINSLLKEE